MNSYEFLQMQVNERRAQVERDFAGHRLARAARKAKPRTWLRRSARTISAAGSVAAPPSIVGVVPAPGTVAFHEWTAALGVQLAEGGVRTVGAQLRALAWRARELQVEPMLAALLADPRQPDVARARALARVAAALDAVAIAAPVRPSAAA